MSRAIRTTALLGVAALGLCATATARPLYATNQADDTVSVLDTATGQPLAPPIAVGDGPADIAITPEGSRAYVANSGSASVSVIDTATNTVVGTIPVGAEPTGIAITPDGARAFVTSKATDGLYAIDLASNGVIGSPVALGEEPEGVVITPDGRLGFVAQRGGGIAILDVPTNTPIAEITTTAGVAPSRLAVTPDAERGFLTNNGSNSASLFSLTVPTLLGAPILVGTNPTGIAITSTGLAYAASESLNTVQAIDAAAHTPLGPPLGGLQGPRGLAASPDGQRLFVANAAAQSLGVIDTTANALIGQLAVGDSPSAVAILPDQAPSASFTTAPNPPAEQPTAFDASASSDPDGRVATYEWDFGDGETERSTEPTTEHTYAKPGAYLVSLRVIDGEGCSNELLFTGQTASCNGSERATTSVTVRARDAKPPSFAFKANRPRLPARRIALEAYCPTEACQVVVKGSLNAWGGLKLARSKRPPAGYPARPLERRVRAGIPTRLLMRLPGRGVRFARQQLRRGIGVSLRVEAVATDAAGNHKRKRATLRWRAR